MTEVSSLTKTFNNVEITEGDSPTKLASNRQLDNSQLKAKSNINDSAMKSTFLTGANLMNRRGYEEGKQKIDEIFNYHDRLNNLVDNMDSKIKILLNDNQASFLMAYKEQMMHIQKELKTLKKKIDEETIKRKNDERMNLLEQERDWFRAEAIRLDKVCKENKEQIQELKFNLKLAKEDKSFYEEVLLNTKKENNALKEELMQYELGKKATMGVNTKLSTGERQTEGKRRIVISNSARPSAPNSSARGMRSSHRDEENDQGFKSIHDNEEMVLDQEALFSSQEKLMEIIKQMKVELDKEKKMTRQLRQERSQSLVKRIDLEHILVDAINEVKKEIARRRNNRSQREMHSGLQLPQEIDVNSFAATDKKVLLEYFLSNDIVLEELYALVFNTVNPRNQAAPSIPGDRSGRNSSQAAPNVYNGEGKMRYTVNGFPNAKMTSKNKLSTSVNLKPQSFTGAAVFRGSESMRKI